MKRLTTYKLCFLACVATLGTQLNAQGDSALNAKITERIDDYLELMQHGYSKQEIFQDLGNVKFLTKDYDAAVFWYEKLFTANKAMATNQNYIDRYRYAFDKVHGNPIPKAVERTDWAAMIKEDYLGPEEELQMQALSTLMPQERTPVSGKKAPEAMYEPQMAVNKTGNVAYFCKPVSQKPMTGLFSKKETYYSIFRAVKVNGQWQQTEMTAACPKYYSAMHPTLSEDGRQLYFASNMPGSYGEYDIYVADVRADGSLGHAKNLGPKVNTKKNELYPSLVNGTLLFYASDGHQGYGGLDLYAAQVARNTVTESVNLGAPINSKQDDFSISLMPDLKLGYVMSNREAENVVSQVAIRYGEEAEPFLAEKSPRRQDNNVILLLGSEPATDYSTTLFEDQ